MAVTGRRRGMGSLSLMVLTIMMMVQEMVTGESIMDFLRRRSDLSQVRDMSRPRIIRRRDKLATAQTWSSRSS